MFTKAEEILQSFANSPKNAGTSLGLRVVCALPVKTVELYFGIGLEGINVPRPTIEELTEYTTKGVPIFQPGNEEVIAILEKSGLPCYDQESGEPVEPTPSGDDSTINISLPSEKVVGYGVIRYGIPQGPIPGATPRPGLEETAACIVLVTTGSDNQP